ncbi:hypothetical protein BKH46_00810 [Helicobacter sp. 12S02634-8]|uniref:sulfite exporter TauE/SafE family protein n=1 Tax=Helicobacter sp. 12S02634-8 TaxID=1476199 RepID=UPI000BA589F0|nr:sulfite exporter TauE/SafE family protein [Helicobacter sp. 12S02634-8]PAF48483.1 hypothetical protein BKH46_00810 [Helicobacter sp. 12S02634-8]
MDTIGLLLSVFVIAFPMALSHCVGMCGGIVIAYTHGKIHPNASNSYQALCHILYSLGRITSYMIIGAISALIGNGISASMQTKGILFIVVGALLIVFACLYVFFPKVITFLEPSISKNSQNIFSRSFHNTFAWLMGSKNLFSFWGLGVLNGFLPCGMVYYFALSAALASNVLMGAVMMGVFGLATFLPMFVLGFITGKILTSTFRSFFMKISFVLMLCFGGYGIYKGISMLEGKAMGGHSMGGHSMGGHSMPMHSTQPHTPHTHSMGADDSGVRQ